MNATTLFASIFLMGIVPTPSDTPAQLGIALKNFSGGTITMGLPVELYATIRNDGDGDVEIPNAVLAGRWLAMNGPNYLRVIGPDGNDLGASAQIADDISGQFVLVPAHGTAEVGLSLHRWVMLDVAGHYQVALTLCSERGSCATSNEVGFELAPLQENRSLELALAGDAVVEDGQLLVLDAAFKNLSSKTVSLLLPREGSFTGAVDPTVVVHVRRPSKMVASSAPTAAIHDVLGEPASASNTVRLSHGQVHHVVLNTGIVLSRSAWPDDAVTLHVHYYVHKRRVSHSREVDGPVTSGFAETGAWRSREVTVRIVDKRKIGH